MSESSVRSGSKGALIGAILVGLGACAGHVPHPTPYQAEQAAQRWPGTDVASLEHGRKIYVQKCAGCHTLRLPIAYPAERWPKILDKMQKIAKLTPEQHDQILHYILSVKEKEAQ